MLVLQSGQAVWDATSVKALALHVQAVLIPPVEQLLLVDYPLRAPPAADAAPPTVGFKLDEVSVSLKVNVAFEHCQKSVAPNCGQLSMKAYFIFSSLASQTFGTFAWASQSPQESSLPTSSS